ncbi:MAG: ATP-binding protein [Verrucomicrobia bacterium]|nr:ATP-binding protein [Verrucomicrobiota bacterium]
MSWVTAIWSMIGAVCVTLAAMHLVVWFKCRSAWANLLFALAALASAGAAGCELWMMRATTTAEFGNALRWTHLPAWVIILALVGFTRLHLRAGRKWLAWTICGLRTLSLGLDFLFSPNLNFREITGLRAVPLLGETVTTAVGVPNPWMLVGQASLLLFVCFILDAAVTVWRRGDPLQKQLLVGAITFMGVAGTAQTVLAMWHIVQTPITASLLFTGIVVVMAVELSDGLIRAAKLADELRESEQRLSLAADATRLGLWVWNIGRDELWANAAGRELFGFTAAEPLDRDRFFEAVHPVDRDATRQALAKSLLEDEEYEREYRVILPGNHVRWIAVRGRVERDGMRAIRVRGVAMDLTARKEAERELAQQRTELAHLARVNTLGEMAGTIAHELNQPLAAMLSNAQVGRRSLHSRAPDLTEMAEIFDDIAADAKRAGGIIHGMRAMLKKDAPTEHQCFSLNDAVTQVLSLLHGEIVARQQEVKIQLGETLPPVRAERVEIHQVLINLVINGLDAMKEEPPRDAMKITTAWQDGTVTVSVHDSGPGLPPEIIPRLFDPFFSTKPGGLGLGLSISRSIAERFGGKLLAENHPAGGAVFHLILPAANA